MELKNRKLFIPIFILVTIIFSYFAYSPEEISIAGPYFPQIEYFEDELDLISKDLNVKIRYVPFSDIESEIIRGINTEEFDLAIIPNPQGVVNLGERGYLHSVSTALGDEVLTQNYSKHLQEITTSQKDKINYGVLFRLIPNSLIWYDVDKYERLGSPNFESFEDMISFTKQYSSFDNPLWCMDIESGASTGWIATNWLEDLILHEYGPDIYDDWFKQIITSQNNEITLSILNIGKLIFDENTVYGGNQRIISKEFRNNSRNLLDENNTTSATCHWDVFVTDIYDTTGTSNGPFIISAELGDGNGLNQPPGEFDIQNPSDYTLYYLDPNVASDTLYINWAEAIDPDSAEVHYTFLVSTSPTMMDADTFEVQTNFISFSYQTLL